VFVEFEECGGFDTQGELGFLVFDLFGEFVAQDRLGVHMSMKLDIGMKEKELVEEVLGRS